MKKILILLGVLAAMACLITISAKAQTRKVMTVDQELIQNLN